MLTRYIKDNEQSVHFARSYTLSQGKFLFELIAAFYDTRLWFRSELATEPVAFFTLVVSSIGVKH